MTVLITGGAGFIGANVAHALLSAGEEVRVFDHLAQPGVDLSLRWLQDRHRRGLEILVEDIRDGHALRDAMGGVDHVFHFAAQVGVMASIDRPGVDFDVNAGGTLRVLEAIRAQQRPPSLLYTSTSEVYGLLEDLDLAVVDGRWSPLDRAYAQHGVSETRPLRFHAPYGCSKGTADQYVLDYTHTFGIDAVVFRLSSIYGPRQQGNPEYGWIAHFLERALLGESITVHGDGRQVRDALFIDDLVRAMDAARANIRLLRGSAFNIGGGPANTSSVRELIARIEAWSGKRVVVEHAVWRRADHRWYVSDNRSFSGLTGWSPRVSLGEGLELHREWLERRAPAAPRPSDTSS